MRILLVLIALLISPFSYSENTLRQEIPRTIFDHYNAKSCMEIKTINPNAGSGYELIFPQGFFGPSIEVFCDQETDGGGWTQIVSYNKLKDGCLTGFYMDSENCIKTSREVSVFVNNLGIEYQELRGNVVLKQFGSTDAFRAMSASSDVDDLYMDGAAFFVDNEGDREHVYSYGIAVSMSSSRDNSPSACPENGGTSTPTFVGSDYFCDSGNDVYGYAFQQYNKPLFVGNEFIKTLSSSNRSPIEIRFLNDQYSTDENVMVESYYVLVR